MHVIDKYIAPWLNLIAQELWPLSATGLSFGCDQRGLSPEAYLYY